NLGIGVGQEYVDGFSRITFFENNPNAVGVFAGLAIVFSLYFIVNPAQSYGKNGYFMLLVIPAFINLLLLSGSRGALITVVVSVTLLLIMNRSGQYRWIF